MTRRLLLIVYLLASSACLLGPDDATEPLLTGNWRAQFGHTSVFLMALEQTGDIVRGTACAPSPFDFRVPVEGRFPQVTFSPPGGTPFVGRFLSTGNIVPVNGEWERVVFSRDKASGTTFCQAR